MSVKSISDASVRLVTPLACLVALIVGASAAPSGANQKTICGASHMSDRVAVKAFTKKSDHSVGGDTQGIDVKNTTCATHNMREADHWINIYKAGEVYKWNSGQQKYTTCMLYLGRWKGTEDYVYTWHLDVDNGPQTCGWKSGPIKVKHVGKGEWDDGTIKSKTVYVTDTKL